jgi:hypothetical protein
VARRIDLEREIACDDFVVRAFGSPRPYAACLTRVAELTGGVRSSIVAAAAADERSHLTRRVDMLLDRSRHSGTQPLKWPLAAGIIVILAVTRVTAHTPGMIVFTAPAARASSMLAVIAVRGPVPIPVIPAVADPPAANILPDADASPRSSRTTASAASTQPPESAPLSSQAAVADIVRVPVVVREPRKRLVTGLDKEFFRLFEDGVEQSVVQLRSRPCAAVGLLISTTDSGDPKRQQMQAAFQEFSKVANPVGEFPVVEAATIAGASAAIDKWMGGLGQAPDSRKVILVITDAVSGDAAARGAAGAGTIAEGTNRYRPPVALGPGADPSGRPLQTDAGQPASGTAQFPAEEQNRIAAFVHQDVLVYVLNLAAVTEIPARFLTESTSQTGGQFLTVGADSAVTAAGEIGAEVRNLYELEYTPKNTAHGGAYRTLRVELMAPRGLPPLKLKYRPGYYEPQR